MSVFSKMQDRLKQIKSTEDFLQNYVAAVIGVISAIVKNVLV